MKTEDWIQITQIIAIALVVMSFIGSCTYYISKPSDLICEDFARTDENTYTLINCTQNDGLMNEHFNAVLTIDPERKNK